MNLNIIFAPKDINYVPSEDAVSEISEYLENNMQDYVDFIEAGTAPRLHYIDEGDSFLPTIGCPNCKAKVSTSNEHSAWAQSLREELISNHELDLAFHRVKMPCCNELVPVVDLDFGGRAGFARFSITLEGADIEGQEETLMRKAGQILGCELVKIELVST